MKGVVIMNGIQSYGNNVYQLNSYPYARQLKAVQTPVNFKAKTTQETEMDKFEKERKAQKRKNNIATGVSIAASVAIIAMAVMAIFGKGGLSGLRTKTEQEAVKIKAVDLSKIKERAKDSYSEEVQNFIKRFEGLLQRSDIEAKGGKRIAQVQLAGPGGTGKTDVAGVLAKKVEQLFPGSEYYIPDLSMLSSSSYKGQDVQMLTEYTNAIVKRAKELSASTKPGEKKKYLVCFLDEFDKIAMQDASINAHSSNKTTGALKTLINELMAQDNVMLLSATNYPEMIEGAVSSRMSEKVLVDYLTPKQTLTAIVEHYKNNAQKEVVSPELLDVGNEKLKEICEIISDKSHEMEYRKLLNNIIPNTLTNSPEKEAIQLKHLVETVTSPSISRELKLTEPEIARLKEIVGL